MAFAEYAWNIMTQSEHFKIPPIDDLWSSTLPNSSPWLPEPADIVYECILTALPKRYSGRVYDCTTLTSIYGDFLADANDAPVLRVAAIMGVLGKLASDNHIDNGVRGQIDRDKTDTLFWQIIGQQQPVDAKTSSGTGWSPTGFMKSLPAQIQRVLDDCHLLSHKLKWVEGFGFQRADLDKVETVFKELLGRLEDPFYEQDLLQKLATGTTADEMQQIIYVWFIKLGVIERTLWARKEGLGHRTVASDNQRDTQSADNWAIQTLMDPIPRTKVCVKNLCEHLYIKSQGSLDDTARAHIRAIPSRLTSTTGGINIIDGMKFSLIDKVVDTLIGVAVNGITEFFEPSEPPRMSEAESKRHKESFIREQAPIVQCFKS